MKKSLLALAVLGTFAGVASAQSSVTLFGIVDVGLRNVKNGSNADLWTQSTDGLNSSRLGFRGVEDLGGGMSAGFWLEAGLAADSGAMGGSNGLAAPTSGAANIFNRRSTVSLMGNWGEIRLGLRAGDGPRVLHAPRGASTPAPQRARVGDLPSGRDAAIFLSLCPMVILPSSTRPRGSAATWFWERWSPPGRPPSGSADSPPASASPKSP